MRRFLIAVLTAIALQVALASITLACSCFSTCTGVDTNRQRAEKRIKGGAALFGTVIELVDDTAANKQSADSWHYIAKVRVERSWRQATQEFVYVRAERNNGANCGTDLQVGTAYLFFVKITARENVSISQCDIGPSEYKQYFGKGKAPRKPSR